MNNIEIYIIVEGQTEQTFVRDILAPYMGSKGFYLHSVLIGTPGHKGGNIIFDRAETDIGNFLKQRSDTYVSTMFDYFKIDTKWPGIDEVRGKIKNGINLSSEKKANTLEIATLSRIKELFPGCDVESRFVPYIEMHEFEALLFSNPYILAQKIEKIKVGEINKILEEYNSPEEINDDPLKVPSKRLKSFDPTYRKVVMGSTIAKSIGIAKMREQCPHFNNWLIRLESLAGADI